MYWLTKENVDACPPTSCSLGLLQEGSGAYHQWWRHMNWAFEPTCLIPKQAKDKASVMSSYTHLQSDPHHIPTAQNIVISNFKLTRK